MQRQLLLAEGSHKLTGKIAHTHRKLTQNEEFNEHNPQKIVSFEEEKEIQEKIRTERLIKIMDSKIKEEIELPKEDLKSETNMTMELENLRLKGERLRKKLEASSKPDVLHDLIPQKNEEFTLLPTLSELQALSFSHDPTEIPKIIIPDKPFSDLASITHLKLTIYSLSMFASRKDLNPYLECIIPLPAIEGNKNDNFKISQKGSLEDTYNFSHESLHHVIVSDGVFSKLASSSIKFKLFGSEKGKIIELGKAEVTWEKIILSQGFLYSSDLEVNSEEIKAKRIMQKSIGRLSVSLSLINDKQVNISEIKSVESKSVESKSEPLKSYLLYLYLDHITKLRISNLNLFIKYKTFPDAESIITDILWNYSDSYPIAHKMVTAVLGTELIVNKLSNSSMIIEIWNKQNTQDELIGIVKLPLQLFSSYITSGDCLSNSVYPIIAFDEYKIINSIKTGEEIGYFKLCLAMGSPIQVNKLRQTHETQKNQYKEHIKMEPEHDKIEFIDKSVQMSENHAEPEDIITQSIESIGDIAAFLNQKDKPQDENAKESYEIPKSLDDIHAFLNENLFELEKIESKPIENIIKDIPKPEIEKTIEEIIDSLISCLQVDNINLEEELKIADRFSYGYMHKESLSYFLCELRLGLTQSEINRFIDYILSICPSSIIRRVQFTDILHALNLIQPLFTKHTFTVTIISISSCSILSKFTGNHVYIKYQFPTESNNIETDLLEPLSSMQINLKSIHSCTFPKSKLLSECFSEKIEGICIFLCRYSNKGEEKIIGKGLLPIEEIIELENNHKLNRVICLYGDNNEELQIHRSDLIGKVKISIEYVADYSYQAVNSSSELLYEKQTQIDRKIPRNNTLAIMLESFTELNRGINYMKSIGFEITNYNKISFTFSVFHNSKELLIEYPEIEIAECIVKDTEVLNSLKYIDLILSNEILEYLNHSSGLLSLYFDKELLGTCKVPLLQLLLHSSVRGEYAILNEYGQFMGIVNLILSFSVDEFLKKISLPEPIPEPPGIKFQITIESALNLKSDINGEYPNIFVNFTWFDGITYSTNPILRSTCPAWNKIIAVSMQNDHKLLEKPLAFNVIHKSSRGDQKIGEALVDLTMILAVKKIDGWYHIMNGGKQIGQLKIKIFYDGDAYLKFTGKIKEDVFNRLPSPQIIEKTVASKGKIENKFEERLKLYGESLENDIDDDIFAKHQENMRSIENLAKNLELRLSGNFRNTSPLKSSPLRKSRENSPYKRFVPVEVYSRKSPQRYSQPLKKTRENSPPLRKNLENHQPLRRSRENSPPSRISRDISPPSRISRDISPPSRISRDISPPSRIIKNISPLKYSHPDMNLYEYHSSNSFPLRKSRENSPPIFLASENKLNEYHSSNSFPLRKSRENSPPDRRFIPYDHQTTNIYNNTSPSTVQNKEHESFKYSDPYKYNYNENQYPLKENIYNQYQHHEVYDYEKDKEREKEREKEKEREIEIEIERKNRDHIKKSGIIEENYEYKEVIPNYGHFEGNEEYDDWDPDKIANMLKTIEEASKFGEKEEENEDAQQINDYRSKKDEADDRSENIYTRIYENPLKSREFEYKEPEFYEEKPASYELYNQIPIKKPAKLQKTDFKTPFTENYDIFVESPYNIEDKVNMQSKLEKPEKNDIINKKRTSPKISRGSLPKSLLSDPEISRIVAIMKGSK